MICNSRNKLGQLGIDVKDECFNTIENDIGDNKMINVHTGLSIPLFE